MVNRRSLLSRKTDLVYLIYFVQHAVVTLLIDSTVIIPTEYQFGIQSTLANFHINSNNDVLLASPPTWLKSYVWLEVLFQLPLFVLGPYYLYRDSKKVYVPMLIYAVEAATTTFACMVEILGVDSLTFAEKMNLQLLYGPIIAVTLWMAVDMSVRISKWIPRDGLFVKSK